MPRCHETTARLMAEAMKVMTQTAPWPQDLVDAVAELEYVPGWVVTLAEEKRGQDCAGLTLNIYPDKPDSYHPENHVRTRFLYPVPAAAFNRESWEEWLWARIEETEGHERAEWFRFRTVVTNYDVYEPCAECGHQATKHDGRYNSCADCDPAEEHRFAPSNIRYEYRRPFKPAHPDGWDPGVVRSVVSQTVVNTPNAGRFVKIPCIACGHQHEGTMGEHFTIEVLFPCREDDCECRL